MRKILYLLFIIVLAATACSKHSAADSNDTIYAVSIEPQRWLLEQLVDSGAEIVTMLTPGSNPETYEPSLSRRALADNAVMYFATGALPFEDALEASSSIPFVNTSEGIVPIYGTHDHAHSHHEHGKDHTHGDGHGDAHSHEGAPDPHFWTSLSGAAAMARNMAASLTLLNPEDAPIYAKRLKALLTRLDSLNVGIAAELVDAPSKTFAVWHPSLSYFARDYGLEQLAVGQESKEMSARQTREIIDRAKTDSVRVFFFQKEFDARQAEAINKEIGSRLVTIDPLDYHLDRQLQTVADAIAHP